MVKQEIEQLLQQKMTVENGSQIMLAHPEEMVFVQVKPQDIDLFNKLMEAYDHMTLVTTVEADKGILGLWVTPDTKSVKNHYQTALCGAAFGLTGTV